MINNKINSNQQEPETNLDDLKSITAKTLSSLLSMSESHVYSLAAKGILPHFNINGLIRFPEVDIKIFLTLNYVPGVLEDPDV